MKKINIIFSVILLSLLLTTAYFYYNSYIKKEVASNINKMEKVEEVIDKANENQTDINLDAGLSLINSYLGFQNIDEGIELLELLNNEYPNNSNVYWYLGICNYYINNFELAIEWFNRIPQPTENVYKNLSELYLLQGDINMSKTFAEKAVELAKENLDEGMVNVMPIWKKGYDSFILEGNTNPNRTFEYTSDFFYSARIEFFRRSMENYDGSVDNNKLKEIAFLEMELHQFDNAEKLVSMINKSSKQPAMLMLEDLLSGVTSAEQQSKLTIIGKAFDSFYAGNAKEAYKLLNTKLSDESFENQELVLFTLFYLHTLENDLEESTHYYEEFMTYLTDRYDPDIWYALKNTLIKKQKDLRETT
ncbi:hypothetical protein ABE096_00825 [Robertmurraya massiliosenegalensis]|uniref:tetratricopeptide repeat protein n=1 Tax=Robertmurraya TaxID=2837507 RepID=UPI0039A45AED